MRKIRIASALLSLAMAVSILPVSSVTLAKEDTEKEYLAFTAPDSAYVNMHGSLESRSASFIDGISLGISDTKDPNYFELVQLDGLEARKQYSTNSTYIKVDKGFYEEGDELLISIVFYDFGPSEGKYYFEYIKKGGAGAYQQTIYKPGRNPGWKAITVYAEDFVPEGYENGATFRIVNGAFNAFRKIEIINLSKQRREKTVPQLKTLGLSKLRSLEKISILPLDDPTFAQEKLSTPASSYDIKSFANKYSMKKDLISSEEKSKTMTQAEMIKIFMDIAGIDYENQTSIVDYALSIGFVESSSYFLFDEAPATYFNLGSLLNDILYYESSKDNPFILELYNKGFFGKLTIAQIGSDELSAVYYKGARKNPYVAITDNTTGRTFKYINFYGTMLMRPYFSEQQWLLDGKRFLCGTPTGYIYLYDTETQIMQFLARGAPSTNDSDGVVGPDGMIYYHSTYNGYNTFNRIDPNDPNLESKVVYTYPEGVTSVTEYIAADGTYFGGDIRDPYDKLGKVPDPDYHKVVTFFIKEGNIPGVPDYNHKIVYYKFPNPDMGTLNHVQSNPVYPELSFFVHEANIAGGYEYNHITDRCNVINIETGEHINFNTGIFGYGAATQVQHESWSPDGKYLYFVGGGTIGGKGKGGYYTGRGSIIRIDKDATHRQYYNFPNSDQVNMNHCFPGENNDYIAADSAWVSVANLKTMQNFNITNIEWQFPPGEKHPYHAHAQVAWGKGNYMLSWGHVHEGILGVAWYDFSDIVKYEVAKGGRYKINDYVECVSYKTLVCESDEVVKNGVTARRIKSGKELYLAVNTEIADTTDDAVKVTFDYLDNGKEPIKFWYTRGVKNQDSDVFMIYNANTSFKRKGTGKWKTMTINIDSANMESIGEYESDFRIVGGAKDTYIANIKVEKVEK